MIKAILFDGDDTLYRTKEFVKALDLAVMKRLAGLIGMHAERLYEEWRELIYCLADNKDPKVRYRDYSYGELLRRHDIKNFKEIAIKEYNWFSDNLILKIKAIPGAKSAIKKLMKTYKVALVTGDRGERARRKLKKAGMGSLFRTVISSGETGVMKPDKRYYLMAADSLGVKPSECIVIGNNFKDDIEVAQKLGIKAIMFRYKDSSDDCLGDYRQLLDFICKAC